MRFFRFFILLLACSFVTSTYAQSNEKTTGKRFPSFIKFQTPVDYSQKAQVFREYFKVENDDILQYDDAQLDDLGFIHERYQQFYQGIEVEGAKYTLHIKNNKIMLMTGNFRDVWNINITPTLSAANALENAINHVNAEKYMWEEKGDHMDYKRPKGELVIWADPDGQAQPHLTYKFDIYAAQPDISRADIFVDAHTGEIVAEHAHIHENTPSSGNSLYNGNVPFTSQLNGSVFRLRQTADGGGIETYNMNNGTNYNSATDFTSSNANSWGDATGVQAHWGAEQTHKYFQQNHGRNSYNGSGAVIRSYVHYSSGYVNAFWDGQRMTYGDGDGVNYGPLVSLDIVGHEITHGVTEYAANLVYQRESGALNESFSDIFGEAIEFFATGSNDWQMGTDIGIGGSGAIRSMNNPNAFNDPDTYGGTHWYNPNCGFPTQSNDYCGVHINSGVQNKWFYILVVGESGTNDIGNAYNVTGIGMDKAADIAYRNLATYLSTSSTFADARSGAIQSAIDLFGAGSAEEIAVTNAWYAVGVGQPYGPPTCYGGTVNLTLITDNYGSETSWTLKNSGGTTLYSGSGYGNNQTINETFNLADGDYTFTIDDSYGDGICCSYGNGSYTLESGGTTIATGGAFGSSETVNICIDNGGGGPDTQAPTNPSNLASSNITDNSTDISWTASTDNVGVTGYNVYVDGTSIGQVTGTSATVNGLVAATTYDIYVTAVDAAGNESGASNTISVTTTGGGGGGCQTTVLSDDSFEGGWDGWADGGSDCARYSGSRSYDGSYSIRIRDNTNSSVMTSPVHDITCYSQIEIEFYFYPNSMESGEDFWVQLYNGSSYQTVAAYASGTSFNNNSFYSATVTLSSNDYNFANNARIRFRCDASGNADRIYIDKVKITGSNPSAFIGAPLTSSQSITPLGPIHTTDVDDAADMEELSREIALFPNPTTGFLNIRTEAEISAIRILNVNGAVVRDIPNFRQGDVLDVSNLQTGFYIISMNTPQGVVNKKFVKQ
jgi:Zn-dependent metalloprotease